MIIMTEKKYIFNNETQRIELHFTKDEYQALTNEEKNELKRYYLWSRNRRAWVSRSTKGHFHAIRIAEKLGFTEGEKIGERLSYEEELQHKTTKAQARAERYEKLAEKAKKRAEELQAEFNKYRGDWAFLTQPNINSSRGRAFTRQRQRILDRYVKGFDEYRKSEHFKQKAITAKAIANMEELNNKRYLQNRIEETNKAIRNLEKLIVLAEEKNNHAQLETLLEKMEYEIDKLAFFENKLEELGGIQYNKDNLKVGYLVKIRNNWGVVKKLNPKTLEVQLSFMSHPFKYTYADIEAVKIPEDWEEEEKQELKNPFKEGNILIRRNLFGNAIKAYQVIKTTRKTVTIQEIALRDGVPVANEFINDKQVRRQVKQDKQGNFVVNDGDWYLYQYQE